MNERFTSVFFLGEELHADGAPLLVASGALFRDNMTGGVLAQLRLKNLDRRVLRAVKLRLFPGDTAGRKLGEPMIYDYLDLNVPRGGIFGDERLTPMPNYTTRWFRVEILEAIYTEGFIWTAPEGLVWAPLPPALTLESRLGDPDLIRELRSQKGENCRFQPVRYEGLWRCACGEPVLGETCPLCGRTFFTIDPSALEAARSQRLMAQREAAHRAEADAAIRARAAEREKAEAKTRARARRKKLGRILGIVIPVLLLVAAGILLGIPGYSMYRAEQAVQAGDIQAAETQYREAETWRLFNTLFHPDEKAAALHEETEYQATVEAYRRGDAEALQHGMDADDGSMEERLNQALREELGERAQDLDTAAEAADRGDYRRVLNVMTELAEKTRTPETQLAFSQQCYAYAARAEEAAQPKYAFGLYALAAYGDYETRMEECNRQYLSTDHQLEAYIQQNMSGKGNLSRVDFRLEDEYLMLTLSYSAQSEPDLKISYIGKGSMQDAYHTRIPAGKDQSYTARLRLSALSKEDLRYLSISLSFDGGEYYQLNEDSISLTVEELRSATADLYGNPVF